MKKRNQSHSSLDLHVAVVVDAQLVLHETNGEKLLNSTPFQQVEAGLEATNFEKARLQLLAGSHQRAVAHLFLDPSGKRTTLRQLQSGMDGTR